MESRSSHTLLRLLAAFALFAGIAIGVMAQDSDVDTDPNSPTPVILSEPDSTRALAMPRSSLGRVDITKAGGRPVPMNARIVLFVTNLSLMKGEGASAFRLYVEDKDGKSYRFPVLDINPYRAGGSTVNDIYAVTVQLSDENGFWMSPPQDGDVLVGLTWRGLMSNRVRLGLGAVGGTIKDDAGAKPTPLTEVGKSLGRNISPDYAGYKWAGDRMRFLEQATFGPSPLLDNRVRRIGIRSWLADQFDAPYPSSTNPYPNQPLKPANAPTDCDNDQTAVPDVPVTCFRDTYTMYPIQTWNSKEALYGDSQLRHRVAWALSQIWVTSGVDIQQSRHMVEYHKVLSSNAFGNFRTLMKKMTLNGTMGDYLDMARSTKNNPNENYAREIMQLFTVGLFMLNQDGTVQCAEHNPCQAGDTPVPTYDQNNVNNLTKVLTGWTFCNVTASCPNITQGAVDFIDPMLLVTNNHDTTAKTLLSYPGSTTTNVAACTNCTNAANITAYANASLDQALDNIFNHPNVGPYISRILIQQMVTSDPTPAYVGRVAAVFNDNGLGVRGDLKAVVRAILLDPEARGDVKTDPNYGKLREPFQYATNLLRTFNVSSADGLSQSDGYLMGRAEFTGMGQLPFQSPTVFNYYPPGYIIPGTSLPGPEFALMTTGTSIQRANFVNRMVFSAPAIPAALPNAPNGTSLDLSDLQALATADPSGNTLVDEVNRRMLHSTMSSGMKNTILAAVTNIPATTPENFLQRARQAVYLVATSSQYQVQR